MRPDRRRGSPPRETGSLSKAPPHCPDIVTVEGRAKSLERQRKKPPAHAAGGFLGGGAKRRGGRLGKPPPATRERVWRGSQRTLRTALRTVRTAGARGTAVSVMPFCRTVVPMPSEPPAPSAKVVPADAG